MIFNNSLFQVGGVLVMPAEEQLVKITRTGHNSWDVVYLLNVSFSNLILPDIDHPPSTVYLRKC